MMPIASVVFRNATNGVTIDENSSPQLRALVNQFWEADGSESAGTLWVSVAAMEAIVSNLPQMVRRQYLLSFSSI